MRSAGIRIHSSSHRADERDMRRNKFVDIHSFLISVNQVIRKKVSYLGQIFWSVSTKKIRMVDLSIYFKCPTCGAEPQEHCLTLLGGVCSEPHITRKWVAIDHSLGRKVYRLSPERSKRVARLARIKKNLSKIAL